MKNWLFIILFFIAFQGNTQSGALDLSFNSTDTGYGKGEGTLGSVLSTSVQADHKIIIAGNFINYNSIPQNHITRLTVEGNLDPTFQIGAGTNDVINTIALQPDGKIIIGGAFTNYNSLQKNHIARLNNDGSIDTGFLSGTGANGEILSISMQTDGKIIIAGSFTQYNGIPRNRLARLNADGTLDNTFNIGSGANNSIYATAFAQDGDLLIGGDFTAFNGSNHIRIAKLNPDGSLETSFNSTIGANAIVRTISETFSNEIIIGGDFTSVAGNQAYYIAKLDSNGNPDVLFSNNGGANDVVFTTLIQPDGKIVVGGGFTGMNNTTCHRLTRLNTDGSIDLSFIQETNIDHFSFVYSLASQSNGDLIIGGKFYTYGDRSFGNITKTDPNGIAYPDFNGGSGLNIGTGFSKQILVQPDGKSIICGQFFGYNGKARHMIARVNEDGSLDESFETIPISNADNGIYSMCLQPDGKIIIGGTFDEFGGHFTNNIARLNADGSFDTTFLSVSGFDGMVLSLKIQPDGKILAGGFMQHFNDTACSYLTRLNANGTIDYTFDAGTIGILPDGGVHTIGIQQNGKIIIGGFFTQINGVPKGRIARLNQDGSLDNTFDTGNGANNIVRNIVVQPNDDKILVRGDFTSFNGENQSFIRLNADGDNDQPFNSAVNSFDNSGLNFFSNSLALQNDGKILFGTLTEFYRLNSDGGIDNTFQSSTEQYPNITTMAIQQDGKILIAGYFLSYNGIGRNHFARLLYECPQENDTIAATACDSYTLNGNTYTASGLYSNAISGCSPSVLLTLDLTIRNSTSSSLSDSGCGSYNLNGIEYTNTGVYEQVISNTVGCDSIITLDLIVIPTPELNVSDLGGILHANASGNYQWIDCSTQLNIPGETSNTFIPQENGIYAVVLTNGNCSDTSNCVVVDYLSVNPEEFSEIIIFPNPTMDHVFIKIPTDTADLIISDIQGKTIETTVLTPSNTISLNNYSPGVYFFNISYNGKSILHKIVLY